MKYTNSIFTPNMSGKQGNTVFSSNQYGTYSCQKKIPVDPRSVAQQNVRAGTSAISRAWAGLTPVQRDNWRIQSSNYPFQKKDRRYFLIGFTFFMKLNRNLNEVNEPLMKDFPSNTPGSPQTFSSFYLEWVNTPSGLDLLLFINPSINTQTKVKLTATMPVKTSELYGTHKCYKIAVLDSSFVSGSSVRDLYFNKYQTLPGLNSKAFFEIRSTNINSGFSTIPVSYELYGI